MVLRRNLPPAPADVRAPVNASLDGLAPKFRDALLAMCEAVEAAGHARPRIFETLRTDARARYLFGYGRTWDDGRGIVTNSRDALSTWHGYGLAADVIHPTLRWAAPEAYWRAIGAAAKANGLDWGGSWVNFPDRPHVQWGKCRRSPSVRARALKTDGGNEAVWHEVGAA